MWTKLSLFRHRNTEKDKKRAYGKRKRPNEGSADNNTEEDGNEQEMNGEDKSDTKEDSESEVLTFSRIFYMREEKFIFFLEIDVFYYFSKKRQPPFLHYSS